MFTVALDEASVIPDGDHNLNDLSDTELFRLIDFLPEGYKAVFNLSIEGYNHKEIAAMLNVYESTSRSQLTKAKAQLQKLIIAKGYKHVR